MAPTRGHRFIFLLTIKKLMWRHEKLWRKKVKCRRNFRQRFIFSMLHQHSIKNFKRLTMQNTFGLLREEFCRPRCCAAYERSETWFGDLWNNRFDNEYRCGKFKRDLRMEGTTFQKLVNELTPFLQKEDTIFKRAIPVEKRVAIGVWRLATGNPYRTIAIEFGVGKSTVIKITHDFCSALVEISDRYIKFPKNAVEVGEAIQSFKDDVNCKIPQSFCAVDGTLIEILAPSTERKIDYFARTKRYAVNTQGIVGANLVFSHVATGFPGSIHDARMWTKTEIHTKIESEAILQYPEKIIGNFRVKPLILGEGAYTLSPNLMKPYRRTIQLSREQRKLNKKLSSA